MSIYRKKYKGFAGVLFILANLIAVFGGIFLLIQKDYAKTAAGHNAMAWSGGILLFAFALFWGIGFFTSGKRSQ